MCTYTVYLYICTYAEVLEGELNVIRLDEK